MSEEERQFLLGKGVVFQRIRRITGYLVGGLERFNNAKRSEEKDRVKHGCDTAFTARSGLSRELAETERHEEAGEHEKA